MGAQSTAKTIFLLVSMVGWMLVGGALMYLSPAFVDRFFPSDTTHLWMQNLGQGSYNPSLALVGGGIALTLTVVGNVVWYQRFEGKL